MDLVFSDWGLIVLVATLSLIFGSFLNVVIYRTPIILDRRWKAECRDYLDIPNPESSETHFSVVWPGSACPHCKTPIKAWQNIPLLSYIVLKGKCANCSATISIRYPLVEALTATLSILIALQLGAGPELVGALIFTWSLIALAGIDLDTQLLPDVIVFPLMWLGLILNSFGFYTDLGSALWGAVIGYMSLWTVFWIFKLLTGKEGMGFGDFKLLAALGAWSGWQSLPMIILVSSATGLVIAVLMMIFLSHDRRKPIAFGPYLAIGGWLAFTYGAEISAAAPLLFPIH